MTGPINPLAVVRAALVRAKAIPEGTVTPPATGEVPDPDPVVVPAQTVIGPSVADLPDFLLSPDGSSYSLADSVGLLWALLQSMEIRAVTGHVTVAAVPGGSGGTIWGSGVTFERSITWNEVAPSVPTGVLVSAEAGILTAGKTVGRVVPGTATTTGATLALTNVSGGNVVVNGANPITYNAQALYLHTPPLETL